MPRERASMNNNGEKIDQNVKISTVKTFVINMRKNILQGSYCRERKYRAEMVIMNEYSIDICENNIETRTKDLQ